MNTLTRDWANHATQDPARARQRLIGSGLAAMQLLLTHPDACFPTLAPVPYLTTTTQVFIAPSTIIGEGLFTIPPIPRGTILGSMYIGQPIVPGVITDLEPELSPDYLQIGLDAYIYPAGIWVYANHSCLPNIGLRSGVVVVALVDIAAGAELVYDYCLTINEEEYNAPCHCRSVNCRGRITDFQRLPTPVQQYYWELGVVAPYVCWQINRGIAQES